MSASLDPPVLGDERCRSGPSGDQGAPRSLYTTRIIKAGALLPDSRALLALWDLAASSGRNLERIVRDNPLGKTSRARIQDILGIFRQRYLVDSEVTRTLAILAGAGVPASQLDPLLYYYAARADSLIHDIVTDAFWPWYLRGKLDVSVADISGTIQAWQTEGKTSGGWNADTTLRVARGLLASLRDWGLLTGTAHKRLVRPRLPVPSFAILALALSHAQPSGDLLLADPEWRLFLLSLADVERLFLEAHQSHLLDYQAAGSVVRITFPTESLVEYAHAIVQRPS